MAARRKAYKVSVSGAPPLPVISVTQNQIDGTGALRSRVREVFIARSVGALLEMLDNTSEDVIEEALTASTAAGGVARFVAHAVPLAPGVTDADPLAGTFARAAERKIRLLERAGGAFSASQVGAILGGITRQAVDKRRALQQLLAVREPSGDYRYPACQFVADGSVLPHLAEFLSTSGFRDPWMQLQLLLGQPETLGRSSVLDALASGDDASVAEALRVARATGDQGA